MKTFKVLIHQHSSQVVFVEASSEDEARRTVEDGLETGLYDGGWEECDPTIDWVEEDESL